MKAIVLNVINYIFIAMLSVITGIIVAQRKSQHYMSWKSADDIAYFIGALIGFVFCMWALAWGIRKIQRSIAGEPKKPFSFYMMILSLFFGFIFWFGPDFMYN